jgi:hypothetical protein
MRRRTDLSKLNNEDYRAYKRAYEAKRQRKYRRKMKKLGIRISSNLSVNQRKIK